jgi:hypothetical protein
MTPHITEEVSTKMDWSAFTIIGAITPPRDPEDEDDDEEEDDEEDDEEDSADESAVVREPDEG